MLFTSVEHERIVRKIDSKGPSMTLRSTYARTDALMYRLRAAGALLGVTDNTVRSYADNAGIQISRANDFKAGAPAVRVFSPETLFQLARWRRAQGYLKGPPAGSAPVVITVDVIKGGTGKTTTSVELALHLQLLGLRVLLIDLDIQANATQLMGYEPDLQQKEALAYDLAPEAIVEHTFRSIMLPFISLKQQRPGVAEVGATAIQQGDVIKMPFGVSGPHLIPADTYLCDMEAALANAKGLRELYIRHFLDAAKSTGTLGLSTKDYDVVIFDCPPSVSFTSTNALAAADLVVAPIRLDAFSVKGLVRLMDEINSLDRDFNIRPELVILPTHYAPQLARIGRMQTELNQFRDMLAPNVISASEEFPKSLDQYLPLSLQKPTSTASKEYKVFAEHVFAKIMAISSEKARKP